MLQTGSRACGRRHWMPLLLVVALSAWLPAIAAEDAIEHEQLTALVRQLDLTDRLAEHAANTAPRVRNRYHFDYARLRADLLRVRTSVQDFLVPQRAQPRDPIELLGEYRQPDRPSDDKDAQ